MYQRVQREDVVRIPPERLGEDIDAVARELTRTTLEGKIGADKTLTLIASNIERVGEGRIVHGDSAPSASSTGSKRTAPVRKAAPGRRGEQWSSRSRRRARTVPRSRTRTSAPCAAARRRRTGKAT